MYEFHLDKSFLKTIKSMAKTYKRNLICTGCPLATLRHSYPNMSCRQIVVGVSNYSSKPITMEGVERTIYYNRRKGIPGCITINHFFLANMNFNHRNIKI